MFTPFVYLYGPLCWPHTPEGKRGDNARFYTIFCCRGEVYVNKIRRLDETGAICEGRRLGVRGFEGRRGEKGVFVFCMRWKRGNELEGKGGEA